MAVFRPFRAFRPLPDYQALIPAPPYDVLTAAGARERAAGNSLSFLHVDKAEIDLPPETDPYSPAVYEKARENLLALEHTGAGSLIADTLIGAMGSEVHPLILLVVIFVITCTMTNFMSNTATTALMVPIAVSLAQGLGADPRAVVIATVIAGSCAYATPIGMPANTMVVGIGGYKFIDYVKAGLPLILVSFIICMVILPVAYPFFPA